MRELLLNPKNSSLKNQEDQIIIIVIAVMSGAIYLRCKQLGANKQSDTVVRGSVSILILQGEVTPLRRRDLLKVPLRSSPEVRTCQVAQW